MKHYIRIVTISALLLLLINGLLMQSVAETSTPVLFTEEDSAKHLEKMASMSPQERAAYRNEQYKRLRVKAAEIGYQMPETPPWAATSADSSVDTGETQKTSAQPDDSIHPRLETQLSKYRQEAADKRQAMHQRLEQQREKINQRIAKLVERQASKPAQAPAYPRNLPPQPPAPPVAPASPYYAPPPAATLGPNYPPFYPVPPAPAWGYPRY